MPGKIQWINHIKEIKKMYVEEEKTPQDIAEYFSNIYNKKIQRNSIANFLRRHKLIRTLSEASVLKVKQGKMEENIAKLIHSAKNENRFNPKKSHHLENHPKWLPIGATRLHKSRHNLVYRVIKIDETGRWEYEHRFVAEKKYGRKLETYEHVHHIDHDTLNNCPSNVEVMNGIEHLQMHRRKFANKK